MDTLMISCTFFRNFSDSFSFCPSLMKTCQILRKHTLFLASLISSPDLFGDMIYYVHNLLLEFYLGNNYKRGNLDMKQLFSKSIKGQFLMITISIMLLTGIGTSILGYNMFSKNLKDNQIHAAQSNLQFLKTEIDASLSDIMDLSMSSRTNSNIMSFMTTSPESPSYNTITNSASEWLNDEYLSNSASKYIDRIVIANTSRSDFLQIVPATYSTGKSAVKIITELPYYEELLSLADYSFDIGVQKDPFLRTDIQMLPVIRPIYGAYDNTVIGFSYMQISFKLFTESLLDYARQEDTIVYLTLGNTLYKIDSRNIKSVSSADSSIFKGKTDSVQTLNIDGQKQAFVTAPLVSDNCYISIPIPSQPFYQHLQSYCFMLFLIFCAILIIGFLLFLSLNRTVTEPVHHLQEKIRAISNEDFHPDPSIEWENEFGDIGRALNQMGTDIQTLMEQKISFEKQKKDYEYQVLQSQINPHFLYNTLNSIKWMATIQHAPGIAEMTTSLAHLLKSIAKGTTTIVSLKDEIQLLDDYFTIQKYRYGGAITLTYDIEDPALTNIQILRFTLQPIVENAIFHGIEPKGLAGQIQIHIFRRETSIIQIDVTDDGIGMDRETIQQVLSKETTEKSQFFRQIGIASVNRRIQYNFGERYGLSITSEPGNFTTMTILLPELYLQEKGDSNIDKTINRR